MRSKNKQSGPERSRKMVGVAAAGVVPLLLFTSNVLMTKSCPSATALAPSLIQTRLVRPYTSSRPNLVARGIGSTDTEMETVETKERLTTLFDFSSSSAERKKESLDSFERIDDAIMGGISTSALRDVKDEDYASWSGVCRTDGGGFCGMRTLPFRKPLQPPLPSNSDDINGIFLECRLASDDEPNRRIWKITLRTDESRGEQVYQSAFTLPPTTDNNEWSMIRVPFNSFRLVRGPIAIPNSSPPDVASGGGVYQIGLSMSKFQIGTELSELQDFRAGFFDLQIKRIGFYIQEGQEVKGEDTIATSASSSSIETAPTPSSVVPQTLTKEETQKKRPLLLRLLFPVLKLIFSEKAQRRKSAMKVLTQKRNLTRWQAMKFGIQSRRTSAGGILPSVLTTLRIVIADVLRTVLKLFFRFVVFLPLRLVGRLVRAVKGGKKKGAGAEPVGV